MFFDTNIICYAFDSTAPGKRKICERLVERVYSGEITGVLSNQVLVETYNVLTRKFGMPLGKARIIMKSLTISDHWRRLNYTSNTVDRALNILEQPKIPFLDLLMAETMKENGITEILTEDTKGFGEIPGIVATNPFKPSQ